MIEEQDVECVACGCRDMTYQYPIHVPEEYYGDPPADFVGPEGSVYSCSRCGTYVMAIETPDGGVELQEY